MGSGHSHAGVAPAGTAAGKHKSRLAWALALTTSFMVAEIVGGLWTGSLALLADAAHMLTDAGGLALALIAIRFSERPATPQATYGSEFIFSKFTHLRAAGYHTALHT